MKKRIISYLIIFQLLLLAVIIYNFYPKRITDSINKSDIIMVSNGKFTYFYEPKPNSTDAATLLIDPKVKPRYSINSDSLNDRFNYSITKPNGAYRIITIGASFTQGVYVDTKDNWTELLENKLNSGLKCKNIKKFEVINLGYRGYDNDYIVERFRIRGVKYDPDLVIWLQTPFLAPIERVKKLAEEYNDTNIERIKVQIEKYYKDSEEIKKQLYNQKEVSKYLTAYYKASDKVIEDMGGRNNLIQYQEKSIKQILRYYKGKLILPVVPYLDEPSKKIIQKTANEVKNWNYFNGLRKFPMLENDFHPNKEGHRMISDDLFNYLVKASFVPCS